MKHPSPSFITSQLFAEHHIRGIFSGRQGGVSHTPFDSLNLGLELGDKPEHIKYNLEHLCKASNLPIPHRSQQVHGITSIVYTGLGKQHNDEADILLTPTAKAAVAVRTADCLPILLVDPKQGIAAAVHAGWRGTAHHIAHIAIQEMEKLGAQPKDILASLGPCIQPCCFEVDSITAEKMTQTHPLAKQYITVSDKKAWVDLQAINQLQLQESGVFHTNIECIKLCTTCLPKRFFSYRRDGIHSGRQLAIVALPSAL